MVNETKCACGEALRLIFACSGASDIGRISDLAARTLTKDGVGKMYCLAGIGGRVTESSRTHELLRASSRSMVVTRIAPGSVSNWRGLIGSIICVCKTWAWKRERPRSPTRPSLGSRPGSSNGGLSSFSS